jgi:signal transduction histidine kinase
MRRTKYRLWPRTLAVQLIAVTAAAVLVSNLAVAYWFEKGNEQQNETAANERVLDRAAAVATTLNAIPNDSRVVVMRTMSLRRIWQFAEVPNNTPRAPMDEEEQRLAQRLTDALPASVQKFPVMVQLHLKPADIPSHLLPAAGDPDSEAIRVLLSVDPKTTLSAVFMRAPAPWPIEIVVAAIVAILLASLAAALMARRVVRPLSELTAAASVVAQGGTPAHVEEKGPDDVRNAAIAFNRMTGEVTRTLESQRHLLSAVGHDLRTPLTAMRINLEFVEDDDLRERLLENLDELQALTEQVLSSARGTGGEKKRNVDLAALVESLVADLDDMGEPVSWHNHGPAPVSCRPNEIRRAVRNLVENAVAYGARADVQIAERADGYDVVVEDDGPGIPDTDRQRVFEPFVRLESSRNAATGGTGLGLTLVKAIVEGHGGAIMLENRENGGLRARMHLPRMAPAT